MPDSTPCHCQVLTVRGLDFLFGDPDTALAMARADGTQPRSTQPDALCPLAAHSLASRSNGTQSRSVVHAVAYKVVNL